MATPQKHVRISSPSLGKKTPSVPHEILVVQCISAAMVKGMDIGDPAIEDLNAWLMENATREESFAQLRYLHSRSMHQHVRRDTNPAFFSRLERLFSKDAYTAWSLCLGYPPETPWLQEVISPGCRRSFPRKGPHPGMRYTPISLQDLTALACTTTLRCY